MKENFIKTNVTTHWWASHIKPNVSLENQPKVSISHVSAQEVEALWSSGLGGKTLLLTADRVQRLQRQMDMKRYLIYGLIGFSSQRKHYLKTFWHVLHNLSEVWWRAVGTSQFLVQWYYVNAPLICDSFSLPMRSLTLLPGSLCCRLPAGLAQHSTAQHGSVWCKEPPTRQPTWAHYRNKPRGNLIGALGL